jgi:hypothetical protein
MIFSPESDNVNSLHKNIQLLRPDNNERSGSASWTLTLVKLIITKKYTKKRKKCRKPAKTRHLQHFCGGSGGIPHLRASRVAALTAHRAVIHSRPLRISPCNNIKTPSEPDGVLTLAKNRNFDRNPQRGCSSRFEGGALFLQPIHSAIFATAARSAPRRLQMRSSRQMALKAKSSLIFFFFRRVQLIIIFQQLT